MGVVKPALINGERCDANPQQGSSLRGIPAAETERAGARKGDATVRACGNLNRKSQAETTWPAIQAVTICFMGREALAKAWSTADGGGPSPRVVMSPVIDKLRLKAHLN